MRSILICVLITIFILACSNNHKHDGKYTLEVLGDSVTVFEIKGNELFATTNTGTGNLEQKIKIKHYSDRIEIKGEDGTITIARFDKDGNLVMGGTVFKRQ